MKGVQASIDWESVPLHLVLRLGSTSTVGTPCRTFYDPYTYTYLLHTGKDYGDKHLPGAQPSGLKSLRKRERERWRETGGWAWNSNCPRKVRRGERVALVLHIRSQSPPFPPLLHGAGGAGSMLQGRKLCVV